ncbi:MAG TPA: thioredoxin family protein [Verrucomicrobiae bacterium]|nr:thioredoxin family protein [Verrucomicrobiae bacterium]
MRFGICIALTLALVLPAVHADEKIALLPAGKVTYTNITVTTVSATDVYFTYSGGMGNAKLKDLSSDLQQHFKYDAKKAKAVEDKQAENQLKYHDQLLHQPPPPDMTRVPAAPAAPPEPVWHRNLIYLLQKAGTENKLVLLDFTGSDWSPWCIKFDQETLGSAKFAAYANAKLDFVKVDFPRQTPQSDDLKRANVGLADFFKIVNYPTCILLDPSGRELGRQTGYLPGGPDVFISELEGFVRK